MKQLRIFLFVAACLAFAMGNLTADVKMPAIFGDHMVLQQDGKIPVWGTADPGEPVQVALGTSTAKTMADALGIWRVDLPSLPINAVPQVMTVTGKNVLTFQDVLIGDVWLASGQSNMALTMNELKGRGPGVDDALVAATNLELRLFVVQNRAALFPQTELAGSWQISSPETAGSFSAAAYFFGRQLQQTLNRPIGMISSTWGGTAIQSWMSLDSLKALPFAADGVSKVAARQAALPPDPAAQATLLADYQAKLKDWQANLDAPFQVAIKKWQQNVAAAQAAGHPAPPQPVESAPRPISPIGDEHEYTTLFNGMINPLVPYGFKGAIWYQGESNALLNHGAGEDDYDTLLKTMIADWRTRWNAGNFPFLVVGLANFNSRYPIPTDSGWALVREAQEKVIETVPNTALAEAIDIGGQDIHPVDKLDVGNRLASAALHVAYGQNVPYAGPDFASMTAEGNSVRIKFKNVGSGLTIGTSPHLSADTPAVSTTELVGFSMAAADKRWVFAQARIDGDDVVVSSDQISIPAAVRYGWADNPAVNLYNKDGFPAVPFRTDDWPYNPPPPRLTPVR
jgi:sialate O-acetylesterase